MRRLFSQSRCHVDLTTKGEESQSEKSHPNLFFNLQGLRQLKDKLKTEGQNQRRVDKRTDRQVEASGKKVSSMEGGEDRQQTDRQTELGCHEKTLEMTCHHHGQDSDIHSCGYIKGGVHLLH